MNQHLPTSKGHSPFETITLSRNLYFRHDGGLFLPAFDRSTSLNFIPDISTLFIPYSLESRKGYSFQNLKYAFFSEYFLRLDNKLSIRMKFLLFHSNDEIPTSLNLLVSSSSCKNLLIYDRYMDFFYILRWFKTNNSCNGFDILIIYDRYSFNNYLLDIPCFNLQHYSSSLSKIISSRLKLLG